MPIRVVGAETEVLHLPAITQHSAQLVRPGLATFRPQLSPTQATLTG